jgi:hypothetical protein
MTFLQVLVIAIVALLAAVAAIVFVPRQKRAQPFELVIWLATWLVAALCAWLVHGAVASLEALKIFAVVPIAEIPVVPLFLGAFGGAFVLTVPLWLMDRFGNSDVESEYEQE